MPYQPDRILDESDYKDYIRYHKSLDKKAAEQPLGVWLNRKRTLNSALSIIQRLRGIPFEKLTITLYAYCNDPTISELAKRYQRQIELASVDPDKFIGQLHKFYNLVSQDIKRNNLYPALFDLLYWCQKTSVENAGQLDAEQLSVINAYLDLLLQNMSYLKPDKFNENQIVIGRKTTGELMTGPEPYPYLDLPSYEINRIITEHKEPASIAEIYARHGYRVASNIDIVALNASSNVFDNNVYYMLPYINEFTADIVPQKPLLTDHPFNLPVFRDDPLREGARLRDALLKRRRTLPANGVRIRISGDSDLQALLLKELYHNDRICLLYRAETSHGDFSGLYDTKEQYLFSVFRDSNHTELHPNVEALVLWLYTSLVCDEKEITQQNFGEAFPSPPGLRAECFFAGGKLRNVYDEKPSEPDRIHRFHKSEYEPETRTINGFIRSLPPGQCASDQAKEQAKNLGYELNDGETYVQPFVKQVYKLRSKKGMER